MVAVLVFGERETYIGQAEELAAAAAYETYEDILAGTRPMHYIDNQGALGVLVRGAGEGRLSSCSPNAWACLRTRRRFGSGRFGVRCGPEYVASKANIADL